MKEKLAAIVVFLLIVSLSVAGCTKIDYNRASGATRAAACAIHRELQYHVEE